MDNLFYTPNIPSQEFYLDEEESKHCTRVLRLRKHDLISLVDGKGGLYTAEIVDDHPKKCLVHITEKKEDFGKRDFHLHIAVAPPKNIERFEWFLEKATEMGIDEITPLICEHSERREIKHERLNKVLVSAMKQSLKAYLPKLNGMMKFGEFISKDNHGGTENTELHRGVKFIAHCGNGKRELLNGVYKKETDALIMIGPEGDFSKEEVEVAIAKGFIPLSLGESRLRTETAALAACFGINFMNL